MPFTEQADREKMKALTLEKLRDYCDGNHVLGVEVKPGDRCYMEYQPMIRQWMDSPRWTTADRLASNLFPEDQQRAEFLAFLVFFNLHVMPYEIKKREENGEVQ